MKIAKKSSFLFSWAVCCICLLTMTPNSNAITLTVDFDALNTSGGSVDGSVLETYLNSNNMTLKTYTPGTTVAVYYGDTPETPIVLTSHPNYLSQWWSGIDGVSYQIDFLIPLDSLSVTIPSLFGRTSSGLIIPAWSLTAIDSGGNTLGSYSQGMQGIYGSIPERTYSFAGPDIASFIVWSDVYHVAGLGGIPLDNFVLTYTPNAAVPEPATMLLLGSGLIGFAGIRRKMKK